MPSMPWWLQAILKHKRMIHNPWMKYLKSWKRAYRACPSSDLYCLENFILIISSLFIFFQKSSKSIVAAPPASRLEILAFLSYACKDTFPEFLLRRHPRRPVPIRLFPVLSILFVWPATCHRQSLENKGYWCLKDRAISPSPQAPKLIAAYLFPYFSPLQTPYFTLDTKKEL